MSRLDLATLGIGALFIAACTTFDSSGTVDWHTSLQGWWDGNPRPSMACAPEHNLHQIVLSADKKSLTLVYQREWELDRGDRMQSFFFDVVMIEPKVLSVVQRGRTALNTTSGKVPVWKLSFESATVMRWPTAIDSQQLHRTRRDFKCP